MDIKNTQTVFLGDWLLLSTNYFQWGNYVFTFHSYEIERVSNLEIE